MRVVQWLELGSGMLAAIIGLLGLGDFLSILVSDPAQSINPITIVFVSMVALALSAVALGAILHSRTTSATWRSLLLIATVYLGALTVLSLFSFGPYLAPSVVLALCTCGLSLYRQSHPTDARAP